MPKMTAETQWLRADAKGNPIGVDREKNAIMGMVIALEGPFKSQGRGEFDMAGLKKLVTLGNRAPGGLKSHFTHATLSSDGLGKFLGRVKNFRLDSARVQRNGEWVLLHAVRGDNFLNPTSLEEPPGGGKPLGLYVMELAESDPDALSSSIVVQADQETRLDPKTKRPMTDEKGNELPPLWKPTALHGSDIVATGDAVDGLLSAGLSVDGLPDEVVRKGSALLDQQFSGQSREVVKARASAWLDRYLSLKFGAQEHLSSDGYDFEVGDEVEWLSEKPEKFCAELREGTIEELAGDGETVGIDGTDIVMNGPAARVACDDDDDGDADCWYLVSLDRLSLSDGTDTEEEGDLSSQPSESEVERIAKTGLTADVAKMRAILAERPLDNGN